MRGDYWKSIVSLKGIAILAVLINHYTNAYISPKYSGFANSMVAIFFVIAGIGATHSLKKRFSSKQINTTKTITRYYLDKAWRIYPILLIALGVGLLLDQHFKTIIVATRFFGLKAGGIYWFLSALIQCYIISIPLYFLKEKKGNKKYLIYILTIFSLINLIYIFKLFPAQLKYIINNFHLEYKGILLAHLFLCATGMVIPDLIKNQNKSIKILTQTPIFIILFILSLISIKYLNIYPLTGIVFIILTPLMILTILSYKKIVYSKILLIFGTYSYSLYLLHEKYYDLLHRYIFQGNTIKDIGLAIMLLPLLILTCILIEKLVAKIRTKIKYFN